MFYEGERIIRVKSNRNAWKYGDWYKDLVGKEFTALKFSAIEDEYTIKHNGEFRILPGKDTEIVSDSSRPMKY